MDDVQNMEEQVEEEQIEQVGQAEQELTETAQAEQPETKTAKKRQKKTRAKTKGMGIKTKLVLLTAVPALVTMLVIVLFARNSMMMILPS